MKFKDFVDKDIKGCSQVLEFIKLKIGLVDKEDADINQLVRKIQENFDLGSEVIKLKEDLNKNLGNTYGGKYLFGFIKLEDRIKIDNLKINKNIKKRVKKEYFEASGMLAKKQTEVERKIAGKN